MQSALYLEINIFAFIILAIIFVNMRNQLKQSLTESILYLSLLAVNSLILIFDSLMWVLNGRPGHYMLFLNLLVTVVYYILTPITCLVWTFYADYQIHRENTHLYKISVPMSIPVTVNFIFSLLSIHYGFFFYIDAKNYYHRGPLFLLMAALSYSYLLYTFIAVIVRRKGLPSSMLHPLLIFMFPPLIGSIIQCLCYGLSLTWFCMTLSILVIFITMQNNQLYTDQLTGLYNRRQLDAYLSSKHPSGRNKKKIAGILIDLHCFKKINDTYGHTTGDQALIHTADILKKSFNHKEFISRYGGDEFIVIIEDKENIDLEKCIDRFEENLEKFNNMGLAPYRINLSIGGDYWNSASGESSEQFLQRIDSRMYEEKQQKKGRSRQKCFLP